MLIFGNENGLSGLFFDPKYKPSLLQQRMSEAKLLGRKTGKGFYDYSEQSQESRKEPRKKKK
jgi:3-hydroxybutyryl-CoA dehydrogenase